MVNVRRYKQQALEFNMVEWVLRMFLVVDNHKVQQFQMPLKKFIAIETGWHC